MRVDLFLEVNFILPELLWTVLLGPEQFFEHFLDKYFHKYFHKLRQLINKSHQIFGSNA